MAIQKKNKDLKYYLNLQWTYTVETDFADGKMYYIIRVNELPGICTDSENLEDGMRLIKEAMTGAFRLYMKNNEEIPEPIKEESCSGKIAYRTTRRRHYLLAREAKIKHKSLSKLIDEYLDENLFSTAH